MKIIVGLGNPGAKYEGTRHNVGFDVLRVLEKRLSADPPKTRFSALVSEARLAEEKALLVWPQTFMNLSGTSVAQAASFYKTEIEDILVVCDDFNLPVGKMRVRAKGSAGGQRGLENVIERLGTDRVARLRIGVGPVPTGWDAAAFVLAKFQRDEQTEIDIVLQEGADAVESWAREGPEAAMNRFN